MNSPAQDNCIDNEIPYGTYEIEIGDSFNDQLSATEKNTYIGIAENSDVQVVVPSENMDQLTLYKGSKKPINGDKECLLIFDQASGKIKMERLSSNINVKKTRGKEDNYNEILKNEILKIRDSKNQSPCKNNNSPKMNDTFKEDISKIHNSKNNDLFLSESSESDTDKEEAPSEHGNESNDSDEDDAQALENIMSQNAQKPSQNFNTISNSPPKDAAKSALPTEVNVLQDLYMSDQSGSSSSSSDTDS